MPYKIDWDSVNADLAVAASNVRRQIRNSPDLVGFLELPETSEPGMPSHLSLVEIYSSPAAHAVIADYRLPPSVRSASEIERKQIMDEFQSVVARVDGFMEEQGLHHYPAHKLPRHSSVDLHKAYKLDHKKYRMPK